MDIYTLFMHRQASPIKVIDYFTNPIHRIKQRAFVEVGLGEGALNTFVKNFTNRNNPRYISYSAIRQFIVNFSNNTPSVIQSYENFFKNNFRITDGNILLEQFVEFFTKETPSSLEDFSDRAVQDLYKGFGKLDAEGLVRESKQHGVDMNLQEAKKLIRALNGPNRGEELTEEAFRDAVRQV